MRLVGNCRWRFQSRLMNCDDSGSGDTTTSMLQRAEDQGEAGLHPHERGEEEVGDAPEGLERSSWAFYARGDQRAVKIEPTGEERQREEDPSAFALIEGHPRYAS
jgi:hypothetical protein